MNQILSNPLIVALLVIISLVEVLAKSLSLWRSAKGGQKVWFIVIFIMTIFLINDLAIIELLYLFKFSKDKLTFKEIKSWFNRSKK